MTKVIVTGSEGLIGKEVTKYLKKKKYEVIPCDCKLGDNLEIEVIVEKFFKKYKADYLVNLFALNDHVDKDRTPINLHNITLDSFRDYLETNVTSLFSVCRQFAINNPVSGIINFSSTYGVVSPPLDIYPWVDIDEFTTIQTMKHPGYCVSKAAVVQLSRYLAVHLAPNIRVNCIVPGGVKHKQDETFVENYSKKVPLGRMMHVSELNGVIEFLCSDNSVYMTGSVLTIDGGWTAC